MRSLVEWANKIDERLGPISGREYDLARECVRRSLTHDRQREQHAIYLDGDQVEYLRDLAAAERVEAREHIRLAMKAEAGDAA